MAREQQAAFDVGPRAGARAGGEEEVGETALEDAPAKGSDPASAVGPRLEAARQLSATQAARPIWASPRFADTGAQRLATLSDRGLRSADAGGYEASRRAASRPAETDAGTMGWGSYPDESTGVFVRYRGGGRSTLFAQSSPGLRVAIRGASQEDCAIDASAMPSRRKYAAFSTSPSDISMRTRYPAHRQRQGPGGGDDWRSKRLPLS